MPTLEALNVCNNRHMSLVPYDPSGTLVTIAETNMSRIHFATNDDIWYKSDLLEGMVSSGAFSKKAIKDKETSIGINANQDGLLQDKELRAYVRPMDCNTHDSTHIFFSDGLCNTEVDLLLPTLAERGITFAVLRGYMAADLHRPRMYILRVPTCQLEEQRSEMLGIVMPLCHFLELECALSLPLEVDSFKKLTAVVRIIGRAKLGHDVATDLELALRSHGEAFIDAYSEDAVKPKFNYARMLPRQLRRDGVHLDTFTPERKHSHSKYAAEPVDDTRRAPHDNEWWRIGDIGTGVLAVGRRKDYFKTK